MTTTERTESSPPASRRGFSPDSEIDRQVRNLATPNTAASLRVFTLDWIVILAAAVGSWWAFQVYGITLMSVGVYGLAVLVIGSRQKGLENLMHEGTHLNLTPDHRLNDALALYLGGIWMAPGWTPANERLWHVTGHHGAFGDRKRDREFWGYQRLGLGRLPTASFLGSLRILGHSFLRTTWWRLHAARVSLSAGRAVVLAAAVGVLAWAGLFLPLVLYWIIPYFLLYMPMRFIAEVSEHMALGFGTEFETTRNKLGWFQEHVMHPHGDGYHLVHHMYPRIPHQNLARAHRVLMADPAYRTANHCTGLLVPLRRARTTAFDLLVTGRPSQVTR